VRAKRESGGGATQEVRRDRRFLQEVCRSVCQQHLQIFRLKAGCRAGAIAAVVQATDEAAAAKVRLQVAQASISVLLNCRRSSKSPSGNAPEVLFNRYGSTDYLEGVLATQGRSVDKRLQKRSPPDPIWLLFVALHKNLTRGAFLATFFKNDVFCSPGMQNTQFRRNWAELLLCYGNGAPRASERNLWPEILGPPPALGNPHRTRIPTFPQQLRLLHSYRSKGPTPTESRSPTVSRAEPFLLTTMSLYLCAYI
jgi:hypothetical protein